MKRILFVFVVALLLLYSVAASACSCGSISTKEALSSAKVAFSGRIESVGDFSQYDSEVFFQADEIWKGNVTSQISVLTPYQTSMCGLNVEVGQKWLIFARVSEDGTLRAEMCSGSERLEFAQLSALGKSVKPKPNTILPNSLRPLYLLVGFLMVLVSLVVILVRTEQQKRFSVH